MKYLRDTGCKVGRWIELTPNRVHQALILAVLKLRVPLADISYYCYCCYCYYYYIIIIIIIII